MARKPKQRTRTNRECGGQVFQPKGREGDGRPWYVRWTKPDGSRVSQRAMFEETNAEGTKSTRPALTRTEAESALTALATGSRESAKADRARGCRAVTIEDFWKQEVRANTEARLAPQQFKHVEAQVLRCAKTFPGIAMYRIDRPAMEAYFTALRAEGVREAAAPDAPPRSGKVRPLSVATLTRHRAALGTLWAAAIERKAATVNPLRKIGFGRAQEKEANFLTVEQVAKLYLHLPTPIRPLIVLLSETGARFSEVIGLRWDQLAADFAGVTFSRTKSGRTRYVPLTAKAREVLRELHAARVVPMTGEDRVLAWKLTHHHAILASFRVALGKAGLSTRVRLHDLRHSYASQLVQHGVPLSVVAQLLGHSSMQVTMRYAKHAPASLAVQAVQALELARGAAPAQAAEKSAPTQQQAAASA